MVNSTETTTISPNASETAFFPIEEQEYTRASLLSMLCTLFTHPAFLQGVHDCQDYYFDLYDEAPLTEEEMIWEVETNLSRRTAEADTRISYLEKLGWVMGNIAKGLTYGEVSPVKSENGTKHPSEESIAAVIRIMSRFRARRSGHRRAKRTSKGRV